MQTSQRRIANEVEYQSSLTPAGGPEAGSSAEEEFDATLGSLVDYYSTLPPGLIEANVTPQPALQPVSTGEVVGRRARSARRANRSITGGTEAYQRAMAERPPRKTWAWVLGGAFAMFLGGVASFALMVGPGDFLDLVRAKLGGGATTRAEVAQTPTIRIIAPVANKGVPQAEPLGSKGITGKAPTLSPSARAPLASPLATEKIAALDTGSAAVASSPKNEASRGGKASALPRRTVTLRRRHARPKVRRSRKVRRAKKVARQAKASNAGTDWEDPYK